ncbi:MAG: hypothetical protein WCS80_00005 [Bacilli bacterium]
MKKINIYPIRSDLHDKESISLSSSTLIKDLERLSGYKFNQVGLKELYDADLSLILVQTGGSENKFKEQFSSFKPPYIFLTYGSENSLASSLEILTYIRQQGEKGEILHGEEDYIVSRINSLLDRDEKADSYDRLGVIGKPSDWLISSSVDYKKALQVFQVELVDLPIRELIDQYKKETDIVKEGTFKADFDQEELNKAYRIYTALKEIISANNLKGLTIRCFDLLSTVHTTSCLALSLLNREGIIGSCEGDVPSMLTAYIIQKVIRESAFQANPAYIDKKENSILLSHCTLPLDMADSYVFDTHFESGIGLGIHADMKKGPVTILKISSDLKEFFCSEGKLTMNYYRKNLCRTQIEVILDDDVSYFLRNPLGNHHLLCYGRHKKELSSYLTSLGLIEIE